MNTLLYLQAPTVEQEKAFVRYIVNEVNPKRAAMGLAPLVCTHAVAHLKAAWEFANVCGRLETPST